LIESKERISKASSLMAQA
jgi:hypothetical protein